MEYVPSRPVQDVALVPLTTTETLASGALRSSVTVPVMVCCCATTRGATRRIPTSPMRTLRPMGDDAGDGDGIGHSTEMDADYSTGRPCRGKGIPRCRVMRARNTPSEIFAETIRRRADRRWRGSVGR